jgi:hypothetical protein
MLADLNCNCVKDVPFAHLKFKFLNNEFHLSNIYKSSPYLTGNTLCPATKPNWLMLLREAVTVYFENHTEHTNTLCGQKPVF